jgi:hypothetical protein
MAILSDIQINILLFLVKFPDSRRYAFLFELSFDPGGRSRLLALKFSRSALSLVSFEVKVAKSLW